MLQDCLNILDNSILPVLWDEFGVCPLLFQHDCELVHKATGSWGQANSNTKGQCKGLKEDLRDGVRRPFVVIIGSPAGDESARDRGNDQGWECFKCFQRYSYFITLLSLILVTLCHWSLPIFNVCPCVSPVHVDGIAS